MKNNLISKENALKKIGQEIARCTVCPEGKIGLPVPGEGSADARAMFVGEAPGKEEAKTGRPFVGRSGKLLRFLIQKIGLTEDEVYITSPVKYLPSYGTPKKSDIVHGKTHLDKQVAVIRPDIIVLLGNVAAQALLADKISVTRDHGTVLIQGGQKYFLMYHPAAALRFPLIKKLFVEDFNKLKTVLKKAKIIR